MNLPAFLSLSHEYVAILLKQMHWHLILRNVFDTWLQPFVIEFYSH